MSNTKYDATVEFDGDTQDMYIHIFQPGVTNFTVGETHTRQFTVNYDFNEDQELIGVEVLS